MPVCAKSQFIDDVLIDSRAEYIVQRRHGRVGVAVRHAASCRGTGIAPVDAADHKSLVAQELLAEIPVKDTQIGF